MNTTTTTTECRFVGRIFTNNPGRCYPEGTRVKVLSGLCHDGVVLCQFPGGEETWVSSSRLSEIPSR